jgi:putative ABC transport system permease protein
MESYSVAYQTKRDQISAEVEKKLAPRAQGRRQELIDEAQPAIDEAKEQIRNGETALQEAQRELDDAQEKLAQAHRELTEQEAAFQTEIQAAQEQLNSEAQKIAEGKQALAENQRLLDQSEQALLQQEAQVKSAQAQLAPISAQKSELQSGTQQVEEQLALAYQGMDQIRSVGQLSAEEQMAQLPTVYAQVTAALAQLNLPTDVLGPIPDLEEIDETMIATMLTAAEDTLNPLIAEGEQQRAQLSGQLAAINEQEVQLQRAQQQVNAGWSQVSAGRQELAQAQTQITQGESQLSVARETLASEQANGQSLLDKGWLEYRENEATLQEKLAEFKERAPKEREKLEDVKKEVAEKEQELLELKPAVYRVANRDANPGYSEYQDNAERVSSLATIFPVIFFLIAALVSLTTMTRMIDEKRSEIGTLKALGYRNWEIGQKFLLYSSAAGITGAVLGLAVGFSFFPAIIIQAYGPLYNLTKYDTPWYLRLSLIAVGVS